MKLSDYDAGAAEAMTGGSVDLSHLSEGYVAASVQAEERLKFQIINGKNTYNYDLPNDGKWTVYPLNMGNGSYIFRVMQNVGEDKYTELWNSSRTVSMTDEFQPYIRPNQFVDYTTTSNCVAKAKELASHCDSDLEVASAVYDYIVSNVKYDYDEAETVQSGYLPYPDEVLSSKKGICFDYASLAAAMLRSQGIPTQLITGYMGEKSQYHAWNKIYIKGKGWIVGEIKVTGNNWKRVDMTLAASGESKDFLEDDSNYTTRYTY
jgi:transglutaminase-like putative cysteine protease